MSDKVVVKCAEEAGLFDGFGRTDGLCCYGDGACWRHVLPIF